MKYKIWSFAVAGDCVATEVLELPYRPFACWLFSLLESGLAQYTLLALDYALFVSVR